MNDIKKNQLNIEQQTIENLANLLLHSPQQNIQIALKKAIEMEEIFRKQTKQINKIFIDEDPVEKSEKELNYIVYE